MPQLQSIVLTDRATTPVNHTLTPREIQQPNSVGIVGEAVSGGVPLSETRLSVSTRKSAGKLRSRVVLTVPVTQTETINGVSRPVVVRTGVADLSVTFADSSTEQERNDLVGMLYSALATGKTLVNDAIVKGEAVY